MNSNSERKQKVSSATSHLRAGRLSESSHECRELLEDLSTVAAALRVRGVLNVKAGEFEAAIWRLGQALAIDPLNWNLCSEMGKAQYIFAQSLEQQGKLQQAIRVYREALNWLPSLYNALIKIRQIQPKLQEVEIEKNSDRIHSQSAEEKLKKKISIGICVYGDFPEISLRCLESIINEPRINELSDLYVGCNCCSQRVLKPIREWHRQGKINKLFESETNLNKNGIQREFFPQVNTRYILWFDDDSHTKPGWLTQVIQFIESYDPFDAAGIIGWTMCRHHADQGVVYKSVAEAKPWWRGKVRVSQSVLFPIGGCYLIRTDFVRKHDFPDDSMRVMYEDFLLGDLIYQTDGILLDFPNELKKLINANDAPRRGKPDER